MGRMFALDIQWDESRITSLSHGRLMNDVMRDMGTAHKIRHLSKHFEAVPETRVGGEYGYAARSLRWQKRKQREGKPSQANVYTGRLREKVLRESQVTATQYRARVKAKGYFPMPDKQRKEIEAVSGKETKYLAGRAGKNYANLAKSDKYKRKKRVKVKTP